MKRIYSAKLEKEITICTIREYPKCKAESKYTEREVEILKRQQLPDKTIKFIDMLKNELSGMVIHIEKTGGKE